MNKEAISHRGAFKSFAGNKEARFTHIPGRLTDRYSNEYVLNTLKAQVREGTIPQYEPFPSIQADDPQRQLRSIFDRRRDIRS